MNTTAFGLLVQILLGIAGGIAVGGGVIALFIVLDMIPRLAQLTRSYHQVHWYEGAMVAGSLVGTVFDFGIGSCRWAHGRGWSSVCSMARLSACWPRL